MILHRTGNEIISIHRTVSNSLTPDFNAFGSVVDRRIISDVLNFLIGLTHFSALLGILIFRKWQFVQQIHRRIVTIKHNAPEIIL